MADPVRLDAAAGVTMEATQITQSATVSEKNWGQRLMPIVSLLVFLPIIIAIPLAIFITVSSTFYRVIVMIPRPGRIVEIVDIDLPLPRSLGRLPEHFTEYTDRIRHVFQTAGVLAFD